MNQCRRLERLPGRFVRHPVGRQFAQLVIHQREQFIGGSGIAQLDGGQDMSDIANA